MKGKDLTIFVRFGGLSLKKQKGFSQDPKGFHSPPASRGFYAMPKCAQDLWLISSMESYQPGTTPKTKELPQDLTLEETVDYYATLKKRNARSVSAMRKEFKKSDGSLWHHLEPWTKPHEIESRHGAWVRTSFISWKKAFSKMSLDNRYGHGEETVSSINSSRGLLGFYSADHCEVFIDEKC